MKFPSASYNFHGRTDEQWFGGRFFYRSVGHEVQPDQHHRRSIRLKGYDYTQAGAYFITIVTQDCACLFGCLVGEVVNEAMQLNEAGRMVERCWRDIPPYFPNVELDALVTMPNHLHGIVIIAHNHPVGTGLVPTQIVPVQQVALV